MFTDSASMDTGASSAASCSFTSVSITHPSSMSIPRFPKNNGLGAASLDPLGHLWTLDSLEHHAFACQHVGDAVSRQYKLRGHHV